MAHHRSAKKRIRQTAKRTAINRSRMSRIKTFVRKVEDALAKGDHEAARTAFAAAEPEIRRGVTKGVLHLNTASRKISRLSRRVKALATAAPAAQV
ncbi:30S ribosomal protein S20 [Benzoatithermus flavus]|uniref:Small ribosomal subunit protein bS20 n=1 Tax=Benzoatithermus flavus TaxID=3108223 RepID=A0ABU8XNZ7_9PROT